MSRATVDRGQNMRTEESRNIANRRKGAERFLTKQVGREKFAEETADNRLLTRGQKLQKVELIDDSIPRSRLRTKTIRVGTSVSFDQPTNYGFNYRRLSGKVIEILPTNESSRNPNEFLFRIRTHTGAIFNVRGYKLL